MKKENFENIENVSEPNLFFNFILSSDFDRRSKKEKASATDHATTRYKIVTVKAV